MSIGSRLSRVLTAAPLLLGLASWALPAAAKLPNERELRSWIEGFKASPRGPFERIRWFCRDGSVFPPKAYACKNHGGGIQHGEWNQRAKALRAGGYTVANVLAGLDPKAFVGPDADLPALEQILIERFLIGWDDGWIFRGARTYRGALQIEDEEAGSRAVVHAMLGDPAWRNPERFLLLRETVRLLPLQADEGSAADVRRQALVLADEDKAFTAMRAKIHNQPDAGDAAKVRAYAKTKGKGNLRGEYERLAAAIDALYSGNGGDEMALALAPKVASSRPLSRSLEELGKKLETERDPATRIAIAGRLMGLLRKHFPEIRDPEVATEALQLSLILETDAYVAGSKALTGISSLSRSRRLELLDQTAEALYGAGLITFDQLAEVKKSRGRNDARMLAKPPEWADRSLASDFERAIEHLAPLEPQARLYSKDRMQVSLVPFYSGLLDSLERGEASAPAQGPMYLGAMARKCGWDVRVIDTYLEDDPERALREGLAEFPAAVVGISALTAEFRSMHRLAETAREVAPDALILAGGAHRSAEPEKTAKAPAIDAAVIGEGEYDLEPLSHVTRRLLGADVGHRSRWHRLRSSPISPRTPAPA